MKLNPYELAQLLADEGGWSKVTATELDDKQITLTKRDGEWDTAVSAIGIDKIPRQDSSKKFAVILIDRDGVESKSSMVIEFAKATGNELRMYPAKGDGFHFETDDVGFIFRRGEKLFIGFMREHEWERFLRTDTNDDDYQNAIIRADTTVEKKDSWYISRGGIRIRRNPSVALAALKKANYSCEFAPETKLFISKATGKPYVEAHHFIPLFARTQESASIDVTSALDIEENVVSICPHWHRAVHHGEDRIARKILLTLSKSPMRRDLLKQFDLSVGDLYDIYGIPGN